MNSNVVQTGSGFSFDVDDDTRNGVYLQTSPAVSGLWFEAPDVATGAGHLRVSLRKEAVSERDTLSENGLLLKAFERQMAEHEGDFRNEIADLLRHYVLIKKEELSGFLRSHRALPSVLLELAPHLKLSFGDDLAVKVELTSSDDESSMIRISVPWTGSLEGAESAINSFDRNYWLANCDRSSGNVVVTYDLV